MDQHEYGERLERVLDSVLKLQQNFRVDDEQILDACHTMIYEFVDISVPKSAQQIKEYQNCMVKITQETKILVDRSSKPEWVFTGCLRQLYEQLLSNAQPSAGGGFIFDIFDVKLIPRVFKMLVKNSYMLTMNDSDIRKSTNILCTWLRQLSGFKNLPYCIIHLMDGLRELEKFGLLMDIANATVEALLISLIIPVVRPNTIKVLSHILCSAQSRELFMKIMPRIPRIMNAVKGGKPDGSHAADLQHFVDVVSAFVRRFNTFDGTFDEIKKLLINPKPSESADRLFDVRPWHYPIVHRDLSTPVGLVNLGNTCYMNSVLQALFMTKELVQEMLIMKLPSKIINYFQQLVSLLLYSVRHEVAPHDVLSERPNSFRCGYQQDSFEYLGFLLDQIHEEEKRHRTAARTNGLHSHGLNGHATATITSAAAAAAAAADTAPKPMEVDADDGLLQCADAPLLTVIQKLFGGRLQIEYKCLECMTPSTNVDNFFDLQVSFPHAAGCESSPVPAMAAGLSTQSLIDAYFTAEQMTGDNRYYCEKCATLCNGTREIKLASGPQHLIVVIKCFKYDRTSHVRRKILQKVSHERIVSVVSRSGDGSPVRLVYKMYAVIVHHGTNIDCGHYYTIAEKEPDVWFKFNDSYISRCSFDEISNLGSLDAPYILFYKLLRTEPAEPNTSFDSIEDGSSVRPEANWVPTPTESTGEQLRWEDLPVRLQEFVRRDNIIYSDQIRQQYLSGNNSEMMKNHQSRNWRSDNDQDPPSSCGGNIIEPSNGYIY